MIRSQVFKLRSRSGVVLRSVAGCRGLSSGSVRTYSQSAVSSFRATSETFAPSFSMSALKELRSTSGAPIVECKKALEAAAKEITPSGEGDDDETVLVQAAMDWLRQHGAAKASSKVADRETTEGLVSFSVSSTDPSVAVLVKVASETDFAGRSDTFVKLVESVTQATLPTSSTGEPVALLSKEEISSVKAPNSSKTVQELMDEAIVAIRENISVSDVRQLRAGDSSCAWVGYVHNRVHPQSTAGTAAAAVLLEATKPEATADLEAIGKKLAMHVVAARPQYMTPDEIPEAVLAKERDILEQQIADSKKPADIVQKIIQGKLRKYYEEVCLLEQSHMVEEGNPKVGKFLEERGIVLKQYQSMFIS